MAESKKTKAELRETAEALCREYNDNIQNGNFQETTRLNDEIEQAVNEYIYRKRRVFRGSQGN